MAQTQTEMLYTLKQMAQYCGKAYETIRTYYTFPGFLPDPEHTVRHGRKTTRMYTLSEMDKMKKLLNNIEWGDISKYTRPRRIRYSKEP